MKLLTSSSAAAAAAVLLCTSNCGRVHAGKNERGGIDCRPFNSIYESGKDLCETIFDDAFEYVEIGDPKYEDAFHMWWFTKTNPNEAVAQKRISANLHSDYNDTNTCWLNYDENSIDKSKPSPEPKSFTECLPWQSNSCCSEKTMNTTEDINNLYGAEYRWDRCGKLSPACERFFVQEACLYECDPYAGLFRAFSPNKQYPESEGPNTWQIRKMPIRAEYCDAWYAACYEDYFCGNGTGNFFACAKVPVDSGNDSALSPGAIAGISIAVIVAVFSTCGCLWLIKRERDGKPMFYKIALNDNPHEGDFGAGLATTKDESRRGSTDRGIVLA